MAKLIKVLVCLNHLFIVYLFIANKLCPKSTGARYTGDMTRDVNTHLIAKRYSHCALDCIYNHRVTFMASVV